MKEGRDKRMKELLAQRMSIGKGKKGNKGERSEKEERETLGDRAIVDGEFIRLSRARWTIGIGRSLGDDGDGVLTWWGRRAFRSRSRNSCSCSEFGRQY